MANAKKETVKTIEAFWNESEKEVSKAAKETRMKSLRREAEIVVAGYSGDVDLAKEKLETAIRNSFTQEVPVAELFKLRRAVKVAENIHEDAVKYYEEFFGASPLLQ